MLNARGIAAEILLKTEKDNAYSSLSLKDELKRFPGEDRREASLAAMIVYGVTEHRLTIDYNLSLWLSSPLRKLHPKVLTALRIGAYQLLFADRIPESAAVNEAVKYVKKGGCSYAAGLVNAVLRKIAASGLRLPDETDRLRYLSIRYSFPEELITHFLEHYGEEKTLRILSCAEGRRPVYIRRNALLASEETLLGSLERDGAVVRRVGPDDCYAVEETGDISALEAYKKGYFHVQDLSSQLCCQVLGALPGETVVDCCAAPGGKSFTTAERMNNEGMLWSCDLYPHKIKLIEEGAKRLGIRCIRTVQGDAAQLPRQIASADRVLCDVPCSGFGVVGRKPEIRYKTLESASSLPETQSAILESCSAMVRPGGRLVYSTCTLNPAENEEVCLRFLGQHPEFTPARDAFYLSLTEGGPFVNFFPDQNGGDGFFVAAFTKADT